MRNYDRKSFDALLDQYILDALAAAPLLVYERVMQDYQLYLKNLHAFTLEEKLLLLGRLNYRFALCVWNKRKVRDLTPSRAEALGRIFYRDHPLEQPATVKSLKQIGAFVLSDMHIIDGLTKIAFKLRDGFFHLLKNYERIMAGVDRIKHLGTKNSLETTYNETMDSFIASIIHGYQCWGKINEDRYKIKGLYLLLLFRLSATKTLHSQQEIMDYVGVSERVVFAMLKDLVELHYLFVTTENGVHLYQLTGFGVHKVNDLRTYFLIEHRK